MKKLLIVLVMLLCITGCDGSKKTKSDDKENKVIMNPAETYGSEAEFLDYVKENGPMYALGYPYKNTVKSEEFGANAPAFANYKDLVARGIRIFFKYESNKKSLCIYRNDTLYCFDNASNIQTQNANLEKAFSDETCTYSGNEIKCHENKEINNPGVYAFECESTEDDDEYIISCLTHEPKYHAAHVSKTSTFVYMPFADFENYDNNK